MSGDLSLFRASEAFRPVHAAGRPIYRCDCAQYAMFYAPGYLCVADLSDADRFESSVCISQAGSPQRETDFAGELCARADRALAEATRLREEPFRPECLTLYMHSECNLDCVYCYTDPSPCPASRLELEDIVAAAQVVAAHCRRKGRPLYVVFHGGGEPTLYRDLVDRAMVRLETVSQEHDIGMFCYVATNGAMSEDKARWLADRFDLVGLSCDGPADVQDRQRPHRGGRSSSTLVERTGRILREEGCRLHVRTTITRATLCRQAEIADYICHQFSPDEIHFEPVYVGGRVSPAAGLSAHHAEAFVAHLRKAHEVAGRHGVLLKTSGSRPGSIHGPYCHVFRSVLNLVPGGVATACFRTTRASQVVAKGAGIGATDSENGRFRLDVLRVEELRRRLSVEYAACRDCFNRYHCVRECPDLCPLEDPLRDGDVWRPGFRCRAQRALTYATLREVAERLWSAALAERNELERGNSHAPQVVRGTSIL